MELSGERRACNWLNSKERGCGQGQNRTADTRIFSPLLYRLSYLATALKYCLKGRGSQVRGRVRVTCFVFRKQVTFTNFDSELSAR
jgi:hypothetical protein